jgi:hypothetical protein
VPAYAGAAVERSPGQEKSAFESDFLMGQEAHMKP